MTNKRVVFIITLIGFVQFSFAQIQFNDSTEAYGYWAKKGVIEVIYAYMQDYVATVGEAKAKAEIVGKDKYFDEFIKDIDSKESLPTFTQISKFLKNNSWDGAEKTLFNPIKRNFEKRKTLDRIFFNCTKPSSDDLVTFIPGQNNLNKHWNTKINEILSKYNESLLSLNKEQPKVVESNPEPTNFENNKPQTETKQPEEKSKKNPKQIPWGIFLLYGSFLIAGIFIGGRIVFSISKRKIKAIINAGNESKYKDYLYADNERKFLFGYLRVVSFLQKQKDKYKIESKSLNQNNSTKTDYLEQKISLLEKEKRDLLNKNIELNNKLEQKATQKKESNAESHYAKSESFNSQNQKNTSKLYFSMPESDGSFQISNGESSNDGKKYFRIEFKESSTKGELFYLSGDRDQRSINRLESYLKPVCEIENIANSSTATRIELIQSGKVTLINDSWVIDPANKVKIKLY